MSAQDPVSPSKAERPDLDWSQVRETVMMLQAATAQIRLSMTEGHESVTTLTDSFTSLVGKVGMIGEAAKHLDDSNEKDTILSNHQELHDKIQAAIIAFQFYDRLTQRLDHVVHSLSSLGDLVSNSQRLYNPYEWKGLQDTIKARYTIETDRAMFDAILHGATVEEALNVFREKVHEEEEADDIEFF